MRVQEGCDLSDRLSRLLAPFFTWSPLLTIAHRSSRRVPSHVNSGFYDNTTKSLIQYQTTREKVISCEECVVGTDCDRAGILLAELPVRPGYYRVHPTSVDVRECPDLVKCKLLSEARKHAHRLHSGPAR